MNETTESEKQEQQANDSQLLNEVVEGRQVVYIEGYGEVIFDLPSAGLAIEGDRIAARFRTKHLRDSDILSEAQLKAIYNQPIKVKVDGVDVVVGKGEWTDKDEEKLESYHQQIKDITDTFNINREEWQKFRDAAEATEEKKKKNKLLDKRDEFEKKAKDSYESLLKTKAQQLELNANKARLFGESLEEQTFFEKVKVYAPGCIKQEKDGVTSPLWANLQEFEDDKFSATKVVTLFNLFMRGLDVSFFGDVPEGTISS